MKIWIGVTDSDWFNYLSGIQPDEVNFWQPSGTRVFRVLQPGELFLFKLHSPDNFIVGGGYFVRSTPLPASLAWEAFGPKNGATSLAELIARVKRYRRSDDLIDPAIGCNVLANPFFFPRSRWIAVPQTWSSNIVQGKSYDGNSAEGAALIAEVRLTIESAVKDGAAVDYHVHEGNRYGTEFLTRSRLGQGAFRVLVTDAYARKCAITGEKTLPVLQAAHIRPYASMGPHLVANGILLRSDMHTLFDRGYVTVTPSFEIEVSPRLKQDWENGREYYAYHGKPLKVMPLVAAEQPSADFLRWHNENRFLGTSSSS